LPISRPIGSFILSPCNQPALIASPDYCPTFGISKTGRLTDNTINKRGDTMAENRTEDYWKEDNEEHIDTREANFTCDNPDKHLGCDLGIDVAG